jgi:hypothetical protein
MIVFKGSVSDRNEGELYDTIKLRSFVEVGKRVKQITTTIKTPGAHDAFEIGDSVTVTIEADPKFFGKKPAVDPVTGEIQVTEVDRKRHKSR